MAKVDDDLDLDVEGGAKKKGGGKMKIIIISALIALLLIGLSITTTLLLLGGKSEAPAASGEAPAESKPAAAAVETPAKDPAAPGTVTGGAYLTLDPPFVVNLDNRESDIRYLQVTVSVMVRKDADLEIVKRHMPVVRHNLVLLFSSLDFNDIRTREGKEKLTEDSLSVVREALTKTSGSPVVEAVFLPSIVGQ